MLSLFCWPFLMTFRKLVYNKLSSISIRKIIQTHLRNKEHNFIFFLSPSKCSEPELGQRILQRLVCSLLGYFRLYAMGDFQVVPALDDCILQSSIWLHFECKCTMILHLNCVCRYHHLSHTTMRNRRIILTSKKVLPTNISKVDWDLIVHTEEPSP